MRLSISLKVLALAVVSAAFGGLAEPVPALFDAGRSEWKVVVADNAPDCVRYAAQEFTNAVSRF